MPLGLVRSFAQLSFRDLDAQQQTTARVAALAVSSQWQLKGGEYLAIFGAPCQAKYSRLPNDFAARVYNCLVLEDLLRKAFNADLHATRRWLHEPYMGNPECGEVLTPLQMMGSGPAMQARLLASLLVVPPNLPPLPKPWQKTPLSSPRLGPQAV